MERYNKFPFFYMKNKKETKQICSLAKNIYLCNRKNFKQKAYGIISTATVRAS